VPSLPSRLAQALFRFRSFTPVPLVAVLVVLCWRDHVVPGPGGAAVDGALDAAGLALAALGSVVRVLAVGFEARLDSQTRRLKATALFTAGPYAVMRHPLYLGNALIVVGLLCIIHEPWAWALGGLGFLASSALIVNAEEALLRERFGATWAAWAARVPLLSLNPGRWRAVAGLPFDWRTAARREVNPLVAWGLVAQALLWWEWWARETLTPGRGLALELGALGLVGLLVANKTWKVLRPPVTGAGQ
jgi:protein-S-isoprenylcysteine O-methyltransferase Ste14